MVITNQVDISINQEFLKWISLSDITLQDGYARCEIGILKESTRIRGSIFDFLQGIGNHLKNTLDQRFEGSGEMYVASDCWNKHIISFKCKELSNMEFWIKQNN